jgi:catechol 2,3-dioxygenase-like lactoylglutathione lyase family enzyme
MDGASAGSGERRLSAIHHVAIYTSDPDRLAAFYVDVLGAELLGSAGGDGVQRKCTVRLTPDSTLHLFEEIRPGGSGRAGAFDVGSISHFAVAASGPDTFVAMRERLIELGLADSTVYDAGSWYSVHAADPDGLFLEVVLPTPPGWVPPFETTRFSPPSIATK